MGHDVTDAHCSRFVASFAAARRATLGRRIRPHGPHVAVWCAPLKHVVRKPQHPILFCIQKKLDADWEIPQRDKDEPCAFLFPQTCTPVCGLYHILSRSGRCVATISDRKKHISQKKSQYLFVAGNLGLTDTDTCRHDGFPGTLWRITHTAIHAPSDIKRWYKPHMGKLRMFFKNVSCRCSGNFCVRFGLGGTCSME